MLSVTRSLRRAVLLYCFIARTYHHSRETIHAIDSAVDLKELHRAFYTAFDAGFNKVEEPAYQQLDPMKVKNVCRFNTHSFFHLYESVMASGPVWETSALRFETSYAKVKRNFAVGTRNTTKQLLENSYMQDRHKHRCWERKRHCHLVPQRCNTQKHIDDSLIYWDESFYR